MAVPWATIGTLTDRSRAMSRRNGARAVPLAEAVNIASEAASKSAHGMGVDKADGANARGLRSVTA